MPDVPVYSETARGIQAGRLIYLHGFRSSPASAKATWLHERMRAMGLATRIICPQLPPSPREAMELVRHQFDPQPEDTLVGSSLGGYYSTWLAERYGCRAVLLNPAIDPARGLRPYVGHQRFYHSAGSFLFLERYLDELRDLDVPVITFAERYFLIAAKGDDLIDWRDMVARYGGARQLVLPGSDHGLSDFAKYGQQVLEFAGMTPRRNSQ